MVFKNESKVRIFSNFVLGMLAVEVRRQMDGRAKQFLLCTTPPTFPKTFDQTFTEKKTTKTREMHVCAQLAQLSVISQGI
jgi:hypothetical protein